MELFDAPGPMRAWSAGRRRAGATIGFVPTMGALHRAHAELVRLTRQRSEAVVVSIFVNPLQFDRAADFVGYPRPIDDDVSECERLGVDAVYAPTVAAMYPAGFETHVEPGPLAAVMEGASRPGHFRGVTTVVTKLFSAVTPDLAVFGEKDFQQLAIIRRMTRDLDLGIEIVAAPTVRDADGVALSSRNRRLEPAARRAAVCIPRALDAAADAAAIGERAAGVVVEVASAIVAAEPAAELEYMQVFDPETLRPLELVDGSARIAAAVWFGDVRLIDNRRLLR